MNDRGFGWNAFLYTQMCTLGNNVRHYYWHSEDSFYFSSRLQVAHSYELRPGVGNDGGDDKFCFCHHYFDFF